MGYVRETVVRNAQGLHFRPIMQIVDVTSQFVAKLTLHAEGRSGNARSPMELLSLMATEGTPLRVEGEGVDANDAVDAVVALIESGFNE